MSEIPSEPCKRCRIDVAGENVYLTISDTSIIAHFPNESGHENKDYKALLNLCCRLMSKLRNGVEMSWEDLAVRCVRSGVGHHSIADEIAKAIRDSQGGKK